MNTPLLFVNRVLCIHAKRSGLPKEDTEDCMVEFFMKIFQKAGSEDALAAFCRQSPALLHKMAADLVCDYCRAAARRSQHKCGWPLVTGGGGDEIVWDCIDERAIVDAALLQREFCDELLSALATLPSFQQYVFCQHHIHGISLADLAQATGKTPTAVKQLLLRSRQNLRILFS